VNECQPLAYGFSVDNAYVWNSETGAAFFLAGWCKLKPVLKPPGSSADDLYLNSRSSIPKALHRPTPSVSVCQTR